MKQNETVQEILEALSEMLRTKGWLFLKRDLAFHIEQLQAEINEPGGNELRYTDSDLKKIEMKNLKLILDYPEKFISLNQVSKPVEEEDPYENN